MSFYKFLFGFLTLTRLNVWLFLAATLISQILAFNENARLSSECSRWRRPTREKEILTVSSNCFLEVPFPSPSEASIALQSLSPDCEPRTRGATKTVAASGNILSVKWTADEARILRVSIGSFLDNLALVMETVEAFEQRITP